MATINQSLVILVLLFSSPPFFHHVFSSPESSFKTPVSEKIARSDVIGVVRESKSIDTEPIVEFPEDDGRTLQLLKPGAGHDRLELNQMVVERLASMDEPVSFVSVVGPYHGYTLPKFPLSESGALLVLDLNHCLHDFSTVSC